jgi:hypothetical protein
MMPVSCTGFVLFFILEHYKKTQYMGLAFYTLGVGSIKKGYEDVFLFSNTKSSPQM